MNATRILAEFAVSLRYSNLPPSTVAMAKRLLLDGLACLLVGTKGGPGRSATATVKRLGGEPQATAFVGGFKTSVRDAAFANGVTLYSVGLNDIHKPSTSHPGGCVIPVLLAVGEWQNVDGEDLIAAMVAGYEVNARVGRTVAPSHRQRGFHPTGTCGAFGATAAAGRLMGVDAGQLASAFGITGSQAAGLYEFHKDGALTMIFHAGRAAQNGVEAILLVQDGLSGPATILEGEEGFCRATSDGFEEAQLTRDLGSPYLIEETSFRPYYGCSSTIAASGATAQILAQGGVGGADLEEIEVRCHPVVAKDNFEPNPTTLLGARLSMHYNIALVLDRGDVVTADLEEADLWSAAIREKMTKVRITADPAMPRFGATVIATGAAGERAEVANPTPRGDASNPLTWEDVTEKFLRMTAPIVGKEKAERIINLVDGLERHKALDLVHELEFALRGGV
jgi:2-methylcitrate dehydratase PrpD